MSLFPSFGTAMLSMDGPINLLAGGTAVTYLTTVTTHGILANLQKEHERLALPRGPKDNINQNPSSMSPEAANTGI